MPREIDRAWTPDETAAIFADADAIITYPSEKMPAEVLRAATRPRLITGAVIGTDNIEVEAVTELGISVAISGTVARGRFELPTKGL